MPSSPLAALKTHFGFTEFRPNQQQIVEAILGGRDVFAALPTGGGKSLCYQLPAMMRDGLTLVVSPLIALMKDQVDGATRLGIPATFLNSSLTIEEARERRHWIASGKTRILYVSPERLSNEEFREALSRFGVSFIAVDEAHCISEWGHEFRPDYRALKALRSHFPGVPIAAFTATATRQVEDDVVKLLRLKKPMVVRASFNRPEIFYRIVEKTSIAEQIRDFVARQGGAPGIVYRATRKSTEETADSLSATGIRATAYHAGLSDDVRHARQEDFLNDRVQVVVATIAFGMGIDKPNVRWVVHGDLPRSVEGYYQETGRAARDGKPAETVLFYGRQDIAKIRWHIGNIESSAERENAERRLRDILRYVDSSSCRRKTLLAHFDEEFPGACNACDVCTGEVATVDCTELGQMVLSAAVRTGERFGAHHLVDIVTGTSTDKVVERGHDRLPTFGVGTAHDRGYWLSLVRELEADGFLERGDGERAGYRLSSRGRMLLKGKVTFLSRVRPPAPSRAHSSSRTYSSKGAQAPAQGAKPAGSRSPRGRAASSTETPLPDAREDTDRLIECLKRARTALARARSVPPYVVLSDRAVREIALRRPRNGSELLACHGIGDRKIEQYGGIILNVIREIESGEGCPDMQRLIE